MIIHDCTCITWIKTAYLHVSTVSEPSITVFGLNASCKARKMSLSVISVMANRTYVPLRRRWYFIAEKASSIGLKSSEYGGRNSHQIPLKIMLLLNQNKEYGAHRSWIACKISGCLCIEQLSITITEFRAGYGCMKSSNSLMKSRKVAELNEPSTIFMCMMPSCKEMAGRTENLEERNRSVYIKKYLAIHLPCPWTKKALRWALVPQIDHTLPWYEVRRSTELSLTKTSCSDEYSLILAM